MLRFRRTACVGALSVLAATAHCQAVPPAAIIDQVSVDSLRLTVQVLSGEIGSANGGTTDVIRSRDYRSSTHQRAYEYLQSRLSGYRLAAGLQPYTSPWPAFPGTNVVAEQPGALSPGRKYLICAHYDSRSDSIARAPGADDNASGCAAVIEAARILSHYRTNCSVVYALWDQEEPGLIGSGKYAIAARARGDTILGVLNLDMIGWNSNGDSLMEVHVRPGGGSTELAISVLEACQQLGIPLRPALKDPGTSSSDHAMFSEQGYSAVLLIEAYWGGDFNTFYHSRNDLLRYFDQTYFLKNAKLAIGTLSLLAGVLEPLAVRSGEPLAWGYRLEQNYPNPFNPTTTIRYTLPHRTHVTLSVFTTLGEKVAELVNGEMEPGNHEARFDGSRLASGVYIYRLQAGAHVDSRRALLLK